MLRFGNGRAEKLTALAELTAVSTKILDLILYFHFDEPRILIIRRHETVCKPRCTSVRSWEARDRRHSRVIQLWTKGSAQSRRARCEMASSTNGRSCVVEKESRKCVRFPQGCSILALELTTPEASTSPFRSWSWPQLLHDNLCHTSS